jgi:PIN domain nuclease of toxin-antitoxin system
MIMLDTHIAIALYEGRVTGLSDKAKRAIDTQPISLSPMVLLEIEMLFEIRRIRYGADHVANYLTKQLDVSIAPQKFSEISQHALALSFTRDPFDRLITAHAALFKAPLITFDKVIKANYLSAMH